MLSDIEDAEKACNTRTRFHNINYLKSLLSFNLYEHSTKVFCLFFALFVSIIKHVGPTLIGATRWHLLVRSLSVVPGPALLRERPVYYSGWSFGHYTKFRQFAALLMPVLLTLKSTIKLLRLYSVRMKLSSDPHSTRWLQNLTPKSGGPHSISSQHNFKPTLLNERS